MQLGCENNEQGIIWFKSGNYLKAKKCWEISANSGNINSMFCLGILYLSSPFYDLKLAKSWFEKACTGGHKKAKYQLEHLYDGNVRTYMADNILFNEYSSKINNINIETKKMGNYEWLEIKRTSTKSLYLSRYIIDIRKYHNSELPITWEQSDIRMWLNTDFYNEFSAEEKSKICDTNLITNNNPEYFTDAGKDTIDKCFLLSFEEIIKFFSDINFSNQTQDLLFKNTNNYSLSAQVNMTKEKINVANERSGLDYSMINGHSIGWWLRTPGANQKRTVRINCNGDIRLYGREVNRNLVGVRPAIWVKNNE